MYLLNLVVTLLVAIASTTALAQEAGGISSSAISRCAGRIGLDTREADAAFSAILVDGMPWVTIERAEEQVGAQTISTVVTGTGARRRRDGTFVPFRFTCLLDGKGQAVMFHASHPAPRLGDALPPATIIDGSAAYAERTTLPKGAELRIQLLDRSKSAPGEILAEQVVRSGRPSPIPFALRVPKDVSLDGLNLAIAARLVLGRQMLFQLKEPRAVVSDDLRKPIDLTLEKVDQAKR
jgi:uncharacterized lipoprotein YbaY